MPAWACRVLTASLSPGGGGCSGIGTGEVQYERAEMYEHAGGWVVRGRTGREAQAVKENSLTLGPTACPRKSTPPSVPLHPTAGTQTLGHGLSSLPGRRHRCHHHGNAHLLGAVSPPGRALLHNGWGAGGSFRGSTGRAGRLLHPLLTASGPSGNEEILQGLPEANSIRLGRKVSFPLAWRAGSKGESCGGCSRDGGHCQERARAED